jgi:hypothetical protein
VSARIEPERVIVTVLFVDIRGVTTFADRSSPCEAVEYLNGRKPEPTAVRGLSSRNASRTPAA